MIYTKRYDNLSKRSADAPSSEATYVLGDMIMLDVYECMDVDEDACQDEVPV